MTEPFASSRDSKAPCRLHGGEGRFLPVSLFDQVTSFLATVALLLGVWVAVLGLVWIGSAGEVEGTGAPPVGRSSTAMTNPLGMEPDFLQPSAEETLEIDEPELPDMLQAVTSAASRLAGSPAWSRLVSQSTVGLPAGDRRPPGPPPSDQPVVSRAQRWHLRFMAKQVDAYARHLDHYKIELGLIGGGVPGVDYAGDLASAQPTLRRADGGLEKRLYFLWTQPSPLQDFDRQLLRRGRFVTGTQVGQPAVVHRRELLKFIPLELEERLARLELEYAQSNGFSSVEAIEKTVFTSQLTSAGYQLEVTRQRYLDTNH